MEFSTLTSKCDQTKKEKVYDVYWKCTTVEILGMIKSWYLLPVMIGNNVPVVFSGFLMFDFGYHFTKTEVGILTPLT